jgi:CubicO group peptidase (beta-lactamase class C family)
MRPGYVRQVMILASTAPTPRLKLRDQGKSVLDTPAATYVPALASMPNSTEDSAPLAVRHLLPMTSGLPYDDMWGAVTFGQSDGELAQLLEQGLSFAGRRKAIPVLKPGFCPSSARSWK